ncbi:MAG: hypothetical protein ACWA5T_08770 [Parvularcula sp.]
MRFTLFLIALIICTLVLIYVVGDRRQPSVQVIEQEVELKAR